MVVVLNYHIVLMAYDYKFVFELGFVIWLLNDMFGYGYVNVFVIWMLDDMFGYGYVNGWL